MLLDPEEVDPRFSVASVMILEMQKQGTVCPLKFENMGHLLKFRDI